MKIAFSTGRPAHVAVPANLLHRRGLQVTLYTAAYRRRFRDLDPAITLRWLPQFVPMLQFVTGVQLPRPLQRADTVLFDHLVARRLQPCDLFWGSATGALFTSRAARNRGARFILDRACPHVDVQQTLLRRECDQLGVACDAEPTWFRQRQLAEYDEADAIVVPSKYSASSFPVALQSKIVIAPLFGRVPTPHVEARSQKKIRSKSYFTFGFVGANPVRKGLLYLLQAWEKLQLPHARLLLRTDARLDHYPALRAILQRLPNVEIAGYYQDMQRFYRACDAFVFPTVDDGFGMALMEAVAHGLPCISTTHCGAAELFNGKENCEGGDENHQDLLIVPPQDAEALAAAMERIYRSAELRDRLHLQASQTLASIESAGNYALYSQALDTLLARLENLGL